MILASEPPTKYLRSAAFILIRRGVVDFSAGASGFVA
jgi:hypothetical protein